MDPKAHLITLRVQPEMLRQASSALAQMQAGAWPIGYGMLAEPWPMQRAMQWVPREKRGPQQQKARETSSQKWARQHPQLPKRGLLYMRRQNRVHLKPMTKQQTQPISRRQQLPKPPMIFAR